MGVIGSVIGAIFHFIGSVIGAAFGLVGAVFGFVGAVISAILVPLVVIALVVFIMRRSNRR